MQTSMQTSCRVLLGTRYPAGAREPSKRAASCALNTRPRSATPYAASCKLIPHPNTLCLGVRVGASRQRGRGILLRCGSEEAGMMEIEARDKDECARATFGVTSGTTLFTVAVEKPLGLQLEERDGHIVVDDIIYGGNAEKSGGVQRGDILRGVSARVIEGASPRSLGGFNRTKASLFGDFVLMDTEGESFETVMAAIKSNKCAQCAITLVLQRAKQ